MADIQYLNYGDLQIELLAFLDKAKKEVYDYVRKLPWSTKRKERFMSAYSDIMTRGILGASIDDKTGLYKIQVGGDVMNISPDDLKIYGDAAAYFLELMASLPTKASLEEEAKKKAEEEKAKLPIFDNEYFKTNFINHLSKNEFGGSKLFDTQNDWNGLDKRDEKTGLRGREERARILARNLQSYADSLDETKLNFEGSPFENLLDFKDRINKAVYALTKTPDNIDDDNESLRRLGIRASDWFNNGSGDPVTLDDGTTTTYGLLAEYNKNKLKQEEADRIAKQKAIRANQYDGYKSFNFLNGTPGSLEDFNLISLKLVGQQSLDGNDLSKISWAFRQGMKNGGLSNLSKEELARFSSRYTNTPNRLKKIPGLEGIYYDSIGNRLVLPYKGEQLTGVSLSGILELNSPEALAKKEQDDKLKAANRKLSEGWETEDYLRMGAMALDITGAITAWMPGYGTAASGILGLTSLGTNFAADIADESLTWGDRVKNVGVNLGLAAVGMVPGLGLASKTGKWITNITKWAPRLLTLQAIKDLPDSYNSLQKAINKPNELTNADWKNIAYGLSVVAGLSRGTKGIVNDRKYKPTITQNTETETFITTKSGNKIKATLELVDAINKAGRKGGNDKANEELRKLPGAKADDEVNINFKTGVKGKVDLTNRIKLDKSTKNIGQSPEILRYSRALAIKNIRDKAAHPFLSKYLPTDYDIYLSAARLSTPNINIVDRIKQAWNPIPNRPFKGTKLLNQFSSNTSTASTPTNSTTTSTPTGSNAKPKPSVLSKEDSKKLQSTLRGKNFSTNEFKDESRVVGSVKGFGDLYGIRNSDGTHTLQIDFGGTRVNVTGTKADIKSKTLEVLRKNVMKKIDSQVPKENRSRIKFELIKLLKENGYLKQGGTIDKQKIQKYKNFINK